MFEGDLPGKLGFSIRMRCVSSIPTRVVSGLVRLFLHEACFGWLGKGGGKKNKQTNKKEDLALIKSKLSSACDTQYYFNENLARFLISRTISAVQSLSSS